jgi:hypothetical protein
MGSRGPVPKARRSRARDEVPETILNGPRASQKPKMPAGKWSADTVSWWMTWASSPQASEFSATDWMRLRMLLPLIEAYWREPDRFLMGEIRASESKLGCLVEDRRRMRLKIERSVPKPAKDPYAHLEDG